MAIVSTLEVLINGNNAGLRTSLRDSDNALSNFVTGIGNRLQSLGSSMTRLGGQIALLTAPLVAFGVQGVSVASSFEDALTEIQVRTGLSADELERLRQTALDLGASTPFTGREVLGAMLQLLTAGQTVSEMYATLPAVLDAAAASHFDLATAADSVTDILLALQLPVSQSRNLVDQLNRAAGASSATLGGLFQGFQNVGGAANAFGISMEDQIAILAIFNDTGIKGAEAGTQLRSMLRMMNADTTRAEEAWNRLGTSMFDNEGNLRAFTDIFSEAQASLSQMTDQQRLRTVQDIAGAYGQMGFLALTSATSIDEMRARMDEQTDVATVAAAQMATFSGKVETLQGAIETLQVEALNPLMNETLKPLVEELTVTVDKFTEWAAANPETTKTIAILVGAVAILGAVLIPLGILISTVGTVVTALGGAIGLLTSAAFLPLAGVIILVGGLFLAYQNNILGFRTRIEELRTTVGNALITLQQLSYILQQIGQNPQVVANAIGAQLQAGAEQGGTAGNVARSLLGRYPDFGARTIGGRAMGGWAAAGETAWVGERGPELVTFPSRAYVTPNHDLPKLGGGDTYQVSIQMPAEALRDPASARRRGEQFGEAFMEKLRSRG